MTDPVSFKPYIFSACYEWFQDSKFSPSLVVDTRVPGVDVPGEYVVDNTIVLNISDNAIADLEIENTGITFNATFRGSVRHLVVPYEAMRFMMAREVRGQLPLAAMVQACNRYFSSFSPEDERRNFFTLGTPGDNTDGTQASSPDGNAPGGAPSADAKENGGGTASFSAAEPRSGEDESARRSRVESWIHERIEKSTDTVRPGWEYGKGSTGGAPGKEDGTAPGFSIVPEDKDS